MLYSDQFQPYRQISGIAQNMIGSKSIIYIAWAWVTKKKKVLSRFRQIVKEIEQLDTDKKDRPMQDARIVNCGELMLKKKKTK